MTHEHQLVEFDDEDNNGTGPFGLRMGTSASTVPSPYPCTPGELQATIESIPTVGPGNVLVTKEEPDQYYVEFLNALVGTELDVLRYGSPNLSGAQVFCYAIPDPPEKALGWRVQQSNGSRHLLGVDGVETPIIKTMSNTPHEQIKGYLDAIGPGTFTVTGSNNYIYNVATDVPVALTVLYEYDYPGEAVITVPEGGLPEVEPELGLEWDVTPTGDMYVLTVDGVDTILLLRGIDTLEQIEAALNETSQEVGFDVTGDANTTFTVSTDTPAELTGTNVDVTITIPVEGGGPIDPPIPPPTDPASNTSRKSLAWTITPTHDPYVLVVNGVNTEPISTSATLPDIESAINAVSQEAGFNVAGDPQKQYRVDTDTPSTLTCENGAYVSTSQWAPSSQEEAINLAYKVLTGHSKQSLHAWPAKRTLTREAVEALRPYQTVDLLEQQEALAFQAELDGKTLREPEGDHKDDGPAYRDLGNDPSVLEEWAGQQAAHAQAQFDHAVKQRQLAIQLNKKAEQGELEWQKQDEAFRQKVQDGLNILEAEAIAKQEKLTGLPWPYPQSSDDSLPIKTPHPGQSKVVKQKVAEAK
jgi:hypothetical protein